MCQARLNHLLVLQVHVTTLVLNNVLMTFVFNQSTGETSMEHSNPVYISSGCYSISLMYSVLKVNYV